MVIVSPDSCGYSLSKWPKFMAYKTGVILTTYKLKMILQVSLDTVIFRLYRGFFTFTHLTGRSLFPRMILASY